MDAGVVDTGPRRRPAAAARAVPERSAEFDHLLLDGLRAYRRALSAEESRVSYWRRIIQARLDVVRAGDGSDLVDVDHLRPVLTEERVAGGRRALIEVLPVGDIPPLPNLAALWDRAPVRGDAAGNAGLARELVVAESQLSAYRLALHRRLSAATAELIARYREDPGQCLSALPLHRPAGLPGTPDSAVS